jgi:transposase-like protein
VKAGIEDRTSALLTIVGALTTGEKVLLACDSGEQESKTNWLTLLRDWDRMVTFYAFPQEHWRHLRTTNIVESPFASVRLRTDASRRYKRVEGAKAIIWKMLRVAEQSWRKLNAPELLPLVATGVTFKDGVRTSSESVERNTTQQPERTAA